MLDDYPLLEDQPATSGISTNQTRRAYDLLRVMIRSGDVVADQKLVEDTLIRTLGITRTAIREALQQLSEEGRVTRQRRSGTRLNKAVLQLPIDDILPWKASNRFSVIRTDYRTVQTTPTVAEKLNTTDDYVGLVEHCFFDGTEAVGVRIAYFRRRYAQPAVWARCPSLADAFEAVYGSPLAEIRSVIDAGACDPSTARMLGIPAGSPVLVREQLLVDLAGTAQEYTFSYYPAGAVSFPVATQKLGGHTTGVLAAAVA
ncbi:GntR family transcriptional regulator [Cryobacterium sp.]|jgi:GntR family transcriptional regulator|uniref:GntR family transcriptional regulator n=1 Tax=Cryobacterium sp. TaxID=1926290 RepID=UPI002601CD98|nr:GntR family transcriptional regulator [Cryobacterium sp.]MCU1446430.1 GntR family transcriptional regulator [Cryobacterium sp.]